MTCVTTSFDVRQHFVAHLSYSPLSANAKEKLTYHPAEEAQKMRYINPDLPYAVQWLKFDCDEPKDGDVAAYKRIEHTALRYIDADLPTPHIIISNPVGRACHLMYGLAIPVDKSPTGRAAPRALMSVVLNGYTRMLQADPRYSGISVKNPLHKSWHTTMQNVPLYSLNTLLSALPPSLCGQLKRGEALGEGRNVTLFDVTRFWAYGHVGAAYRAGNFERWNQEVLREAKLENLFTPPLPTAEVRQIAKSVAGWTWKNAGNLSERSGGPRKRSSIYSYNRAHLDPEEATERMQQGGIAGAPITHAIRRNATYDAITSAIGTLVGAGTANPSAAQISAAAGVSVRSVVRYRSSQQQVNGN